MKSSFSGVSGCVDVRLVDGFIEVSHTRTPAHKLVFNLEEWEAFLAGVRNGEFDWAALAVA